MKSYELSFGDQIIAVFDTGLPLFSFKLKEPIDEAALKGAVDDALVKHPLYRTRLAFEDAYIDKLKETLEELTPEMVTKLIADVEKNNAPGKVMIRFE